VASANELHRRLARRIREWAAVRKIPVSHLPDRADVARSHFWEVLAGRKSPTLAWIGRIATALEVDAAELLARDPKNSRARS
jgi:transcriptional regulator with XRE-family HTH domain